MLITHSTGNRSLDSFFDDVWPFIRNVPTFRHFDCDVVDQDKRYIITADIPGVKKEDITISLESGVLTISGMRKSDEVDDQDYCMNERQLGRFSRSLRLPERVDDKNVDASLSNGVLIIHVPKAEEIQPKRIEIKV